MIIIRSDEKWAEEKYGWWMAFVVSFTHRSDTGSSLNWITNYSNIHVQVAGAPMHPSLCVRVAMMATMMQCVDAYQTFLHTHCIRSDEREREREMRLFTTIEDRVVQMCCTLVHRRVDWKWKWIFLCLCGKNWYVHCAGTAVHWALGRLHNGLGIM